MESRIKQASVLITGANGGMGLETVKLLVEEQADRIVLACRTQQKAEWAKDQIKNTGFTELEPYGGFDMTDATSIEKAVANLPAHGAFDIIFLQSGGMVVGNEYQFVQANGKQVERTIYQNTLGAYLTLFFLERRGLIAENARIVFAGGEGARGITGLIEKPVFTSPEQLRQYVFEGLGKYSAFNAIGVSKFMSALLFRNWLSRWEEE